MSNGLKIMMMAGSVIITCIVISLGFFIVREGKNQVNAAVGKFDQMMASYNDMDITFYDGIRVTGSEVNSFIKESISQKRYLAIRVICGSGVTTDYNYEYNGCFELEDPSQKKIGSIVKQGNPQKKTTSDRSDGAYINPNGVFLGEVCKDSNGNVIAILFKQVI